MDTKLIELIAKLQAVITDQRDTLANHQHHIKTLQTSQFIMLGLLLEYDEGLRRFIIKALQAAVDSPVVARDPYLQTHFQELLKVAESAVSDASGTKQDWFSVIEGGKKI